MSEPGVIALAAADVILARWRLPWFVPPAVVLGVLGTKTALGCRRLAKAGDREWWLLLSVAWFPLACWLLAQCVPQY